MFPFDPNRPPQFFRLFPNSVAASLATMLVAHHVGCLPATSPHFSICPLLSALGRPSGSLGQSPVVGHHGSTLMIQVVKLHMGLGFRDT